MKKIATMVTAVVMTILTNMTCNAAVLSSKITNVAVTSGANKTLYVIGDSYSSFDVNNTCSNTFYYPFNVTFVPIYGREISCEGWHPTVAGMEAIANKFLPYVTI